MSAQSLCAKCEDLPFCDGNDRLTVPVWNVVDQVTFSQCESWGGSENLSGFIDPAYKKHDCLPIPTGKLSTFIIFPSLAILAGPDGKLPPLISFM